MPNVACEWLTLATSQVADFGIPLLSSEQSYGIPMTSDVLPDDLNLPGWCVKNQNYVVEHFLIFVTHVLIF